MPNALDVRYVVGCVGGARSNVWHITVRRGDVYVSSARTGGVEKLSFHESGICRKAFTAEYGAPAGLSDRATIKWRRAVTPPAGADQAAFVFEVGIPTNLLSQVSTALTKKVTWVNPALPGMATVLSMFYTRDSEARVAAQTGYGTVLAYTALPSGEAFVVRCRPAAWEGKDFRIPASHHAEEDIIFSSRDPENTGRPVRATIFSNPKDGEKMLAWEYGGYRIDRTILHDFSSMDTFDRSTVLVHNKDGRSSKKTT
jgi:hypothetical protein